MTNDDLQERIARTRALIVAVEDAIETIMLGGATQSYTLDTGQSRQTVTRADLPRLDEMLDRLYNRCATLQARLDGGNVAQGRPGW